MKSSHPEDLKRFYIDDLYPLRNITHYFFLFYVSFNAMDPVYSPLLATTWRTSFSLLRYRSMLFFSSSGKLQMRCDYTLATS